MEGKGVLTRNHRQEALSRAYVQAIAARCGLVCSVSREYDYGVDLTFHAIVRRGRRYADAGFCIDVQLKSTTEANVVVSDTEVCYDLEVKAYDDLRDPVGRNRILVLVVFPAEESLWTTQTEEHLLIRRCAYWLSLRGRPPTSNQRTIRVAIPRINVLSVDGVQALLARIRKGESL